MKKLKGFTLVEILIVIVIIGILIAALLPRMSAAQGKARDVARKNELSQIQTAFVSYYGDNGKYPGTVGTWQPVISVSGDLRDSGLSDLPKDPQDQAVISGFNGIGSGNYGYKLVDKNGVPGAGLILISHIEVKSAANYCTSQGDISNISNISYCNGNNAPCNCNGDELAYVLAY